MVVAAPVVRAQVVSQRRLQSLVKATAAVAVAIATFHYS